ncbi:protein spaetzle 5 [Toxorhynchites rutilus septentrionalis]|uniref:protein spaetzle 5 n=1 Tax=Toxorhynchites rutilus septentrionalis TaxID=329112 RepID=UPI00247A7D11|nr:protein spaetzle 5 [Toxorhynchites rutilus septentrionalis]
MISTSRSSNSIPATLLCLLQVVATALATPQKACGLYGQPPCTFVPAPPGMTPKCASPGRTFCETNPDYPSSVIKHLVERLGYQRILADEERIEYNAHRPWVEEHHHYFYGPQMHSGTYDSANHKPATHEGYSSYHHGPQQQPYQQNDNTVAYDQKRISAPRPQQSYNYNIYIRPSVSQKSQGTPGSVGYFYSVPVTQYNAAEWLKRFARDLSDKHIPRSSLNELLWSSQLVPSPSVVLKPPQLRLSFGTLMNETIYRDSLLRSRQKRQITAGRAELCQIREMYVTPQAALNTKGNWMYVVNQENSRQLVKADLCASSECSNLCNLPNGYNTKCEQKFAQKRLLTLDGDGQSLYVDTYWFPSCCVCTIAANI